MTREELKELESNVRAGKAAALAAACDVYGFAFDAAGADASGAYERVLE